MRLDPCFVAPFVFVFVCLVFGVEAMLHQFQAGEIHGYFLVGFVFAESLEFVFVKVVALVGFVFAGFVLLIVFV